MTDNDKSNADDTSIGIDRNRKDLKDQHQANILQKQIFMDAQKDSFLDEQRKENSQLTNEDADHEQENEIEGSKENKQEEKPKPIETVSFTELFSYADVLDIILIVFAVIAAVGNGISRPASFVIFGKLIGKFVDFGKNSTAINIEDEMKTFAIYYVILGVYTMVCSFFQAAFWSVTAARQIHKIRLKFFHSILKQDIGWYDVNESGGLTTRIADDLIKIQTGIGDKLGLTISIVTTFFGGFGLGFYYSWELTLITMSLSPALVIIAAIAGKFMAKLASNEQTAYAAAGAVAEEAISSIRTVVAFGGQKDEIKRYDVKLAIAEKEGVKKGLSMGATFGLYHVIMFASYSLTFWYGSRMVADDKIDAGELLLVFFCVLTAAGSLGSMAPNFEALAIARGAAFFVFKVCRLEPHINSSSEDGIHIDKIDGDIVVENVEFIYPSRPELKILRGFSLTVEQGTTVALVGESGCGKSTVVKLIQRFYDTVEGSVLLDGIDIKKLNVKSLRSHIGVVSQEPVLFDFTISENIAFGAIHSASQEDIVEAAKQANAHDFISQLPKGYDTKVGEGGAQLSGGQKQRIAIARALVRDPKILLFDEATSALDTESEGIVQAALDKASKGRTTIIIAHRLSTVRNADKIVVIKEGKVAEMGAHKELMEKRGVYHQLVVLQTMAEEGEDAIDEAEITEVEKEAIEKLKFARSVSKISDGGDQRTTSELRRQISKKSEHSIPRHESKQADTQEVEIIKPEPAPITRIMKLNSTEWPYIVIGVFFSAIVGAFPVAFAVILSEILKTFIGKDAETMKEKSRFWSLIFLGLGGFDFVGLFFSSYLFSKAGEILTRRLRLKTFKAIIRQDIGFFDEAENSTGQLTTMLATDSSNVKGATSSRLNTLVQVIVMMGTALGIAFWYSWKLTLVICGFAPFLMFSGAAHVAMYKDSAAEEIKKYTEASALANQAIMNMRTVASLGREQYFFESFQRLIYQPYKKSVCRSYIYGITFGLAGTLMMFANAGAFAYGGKLVQDGEITFDEMFKVVLACVFGAMIAGQVMSFAPDYLAAKVSAARIFKVLDRNPSIDSFSKDGIVPESINGTISFDNVTFSYNSRPDIKVLDDLSLSIQPGEKVALVGASGCGKSTSVNLLERFYDPLSGLVCIDEKDIRQFNIQWLRSQLGLVSQEPVLFARSIRDNIVYGMNREVEMTEVLQAAVNANAHNFILGLPKGYDTLVGEKGTLISGGQKQRIAIARALIRNPRIMLLDEATSALDSESEKIVQQALDAAMEGRTSIIIAHRLSTIQNADKIIVLQGGKIVEIGTHQSLLAKQGVYYLLNQAQF